MAAAAVLPWVGVNLQESARYGKAIDLARRHGGLRGLPLDKQGNENEQLRAQTPSFFKQERLDSRFSPQQSVVMGKTKGFITDKGTPHYSRGTVK